MPDVKDHLVAGIVTPLSALANSCLGLSEEEVEHRLAHYAAGPDGEHKSLGQTLANDLGLDESAVSVETWTAPDEEDLRLIAVDVTIAEAAKVEVMVAVPTLRVNGQDYVPSINGVTGSPSFVTQSDMPEPTPLIGREMGGPAE